MSLPRFHLTVTDDAFHALTPMEQVLIEKLARECTGGPVHREAKPIRFREDETPESASRRVDSLTAVDGSVDVTSISNVPKPRGTR